MRVNTQALQPLINFIYSVADEILINTYEPSKYKDVILPMTVIRRLDLVLEPTKETVLNTYNTYKSQLQDLRPLLTNERQGSGYAFYNTSSFTLKSLLADNKNIKANFENYLNGFSDNVQDIITKFKFRNELETLDDAQKLFSVIEKFCSPKIDLTPSNLPPLAMGYVFEDLLRRFNEATNAEAGRHFTPREIIDLMTHIVFLPVKDKIQKGAFLVYDPCAGSGAMLTESKKYITDEEGDIKSNATIHLYGQENTPTIYAISKSDMLLKNEDPNKIVYGSSLSQYGGDRADEWKNLQFDFMLTNPPYGTSWKDDKKALSVGEKGKIKDKRFIIESNYNADGVSTRVNDGQLMFVMHMLSKMKDTELGSRIASVHNGSALFTGDAGQGESEIRKYIIEKDWLDAIIALPNDMFYNTGIPTFILIISNRKPEHRKGKVQLINANNELYFTARRKSLGSKRNELLPNHIKALTDIYLNYDESETSKIFDNQEFGYAQIIVHRPLRLVTHLDEKHINQIKFVSDNIELRKQLFKDLGDKVYSSDSSDSNEVKEYLLDYFFANEEEDDEETLEKEYANLTKKQKKIFDQLTNIHSWLRDKNLLLTMQKLAQHLSKEPYNNYNNFIKQFDTLLKTQNIKWSAKDKKDVLKCITWTDKNAEPVIQKIHKDGRIEYVSDPNLKDFENIPLKQDIQAFFQTEVLPFAPDAWYNNDETRIGYEINFNKYFYKYQAPRPLSEIAKDIFAIEEATENLLKQIVN